MVLCSVYRIISSALAAGILGSAVWALPASAYSFTAGSGAPSIAEIDPYLIIGFKSSAEGDAVNVNSSTELGADREVLSDGVADSSPLDTSVAGAAGPNTRGVFEPGIRWPVESDPQAPPEPAGALFEGIDWSGNVAVTSDTGRFSMSDIDVFADRGVECAVGTTADCTQSVQNTYYFADGVVSDGTAASATGRMDDAPAGTNAGITANTDFTALETEFVAWEAFILSLSVETTITSNIENENSKDGTGPFVTDLDALDTNNDGIAVIDIDVGGTDFLVNNSDWILQGTDTVAIFRILGDSNFVLSDSAILCGDGYEDASGVITESCAIFYIDDTPGGDGVGDPTAVSDQVFDFDNVVLNGIALWDLTAVTPSGINDSVHTELNINDGQGCAQFVSATVEFDDVRWHRCSGGPTQVSEPGSAAMFGVGILLLGFFGLRGRGFKFA